jgi:hypothetical protein
MSELAELKSGMTSQLNTTVKEMKEEVKESLEIERRKMNLVIHGLKDEDAEADVDQVIKLFEEGLKMDYLRHVDKIMRTGQRVIENKPRPLKIILKGLDSRKEMLARTKNLKEQHTLNTVEADTKLDQRAWCTLCIQTSSIRDTPASKAQ